MKPVIDVVHYKNARAVLVKLEKRIEVVQLRLICSILQNPNGPVGFIELWTHFHEKR